MNNMLQDIIDLWDIENNFETCFSRYCNYLQTEGKWKLCEHPNRAINNYKSRMRIVHKGEIEPTKEWKKFETWVDNKKVREQKEVERRAIRLGGNWEIKCKELEKQNEELKKQLESLKQELKDKDIKYEKLLTKYMDECDSDSD